MAVNKKIAFIGAGAMAEAMISGMIAKKLADPKNIIVTNRINAKRLQELQENYKITVSKSAGDAAHHADILILAMKPKDAEQALRSLNKAVHADHIIISVLAGISTGLISSLLDAPVPVIRAMPNTSAAIGYSATGIAGGKFAEVKHMQLAEELFSCIGTTTCLREESLHAVTGLSGSGPAYVYYLVEAMQQAASSMDISEEEARDLIAQTLLGAAHMVKMSGDHPQKLRQNVTSPGGTTEAGIQMLDHFQVKKAIEQCVKRAAERSEELGKMYSRPSTQEIV
ncbi:pyrroline-5-carboxylate reductase [Fictibacillus enclensis]|uniref:pyrroline-5-carboxylate reductase n=1 Tax=Fictibacillus enclensis TaxID=1017270 RepID=UPI0024C027F4|nr:pyrroline-5-carboxylate reductase [Fictibacillus enclensis]MDM5199620.1 pyrroline-5-carboxylate reductase [Fictibacillus enclensis]MDM5338859.1 pyrroline-5-carboxylate reductase [Fictibacillus enclensis]WHY74979.1 pyrroline-5-carboxylate reductase [Fictibacillus enclensis]